jgi:hypothetical protein
VGRKLPTKLVALYCRTTPTAGAAASDAVDASETGAAQPHDGPYTRLLVRLGCQKGTARGNNQQASATKKAKAHRTV